MCNDTIIPVGYKSCRRKERCVNPDGCVLPLSAFPTGRPGKLLNTCRKCLNADWRRRRDASPEQRQKESERGKRWYRENKDKADKKNRLWRENNPEKSKEIYTRYHENHPEKHKESHRKWRKSNPDKIQANNIRHRAAHPGIENVYASRRRAKVRKLPHTFTHQEWKRALKYFGGRCAVCGQTEGLWHTLAQDHWIPLDHPNCLGTVAVNIVPLCHARKGIPAGTSCCNNSKFNKDPEIWLTETFGKRRARAIGNRIRAYFDWVREQDAADTDTANADAA